MLNMPRWIDGPDRRELRFVDVPYSDDYEAHPGRCCESCLQDKELGYGDDIDGCCCRSGEHRQ